MSCEETALALLVPGRGEGGNAAGGCREEGPPQGGTPEGVQRSPGHNEEKLPEQGVWAEPREFGRYKAFLLGEAGSTQAQQFLCTLDVCDVKMLEKGTTKSCSFIPMCDR